MKKKLKGISFIFLILIIMQTVVQAVSIKSIGISIALPEIYNQIINKENITDENVKKYYEENHIYLNASNESKDQSIIVMYLANDSKDTIQNLNQLKEEDLQNFKSEYRKEKENSGQIMVKQELTTINNVKYLVTLLKQETDNGLIYSNEYYTIVDQKVIIITQSYLNKEINEEEMKQVIESLSFEKQENISAINQTYTYTYIAAGMLLIIGILYVIKERKNKNIVEEKENEKLITRVSDAIKRQEYNKKYKGILILFGFTIILNIANLAYGTAEFFSGQVNYAILDWKEKIYLFSAILQNILQLMGMIYIAYRLRKQEDKTVQKIKKTFVILMINVIILTIIRLIMQWMILQNGIITSSYLLTEIRVFLQSMIYLVIWYFYFQNSIRVSIYYNEKTIEELVKNPKKGYQKNKINKKLMEIKIIDYFVKEKAYSYETGIYINKIPKEYANSLSLSDLNSKKIIRLKRAKYYLDQDKLIDPKVEKKYAAKTTTWIVMIAILVLLLTTTI